MVIFHCYASLPDGNLVGGIPTPKNHGVKVSWDDIFHSQYDGKVIKCHSKIHGSSHPQPVTKSKGFIRLTG